MRRLGVVEGGGELLGVTSRHYRVLMVANLLVDEALEAFDVLRVDFDVVVAGAFYPQWVHWLLALLVDGHAVREVDYFVFGAVDDEYERAYAVHFVDTFNEYIVRDVFFIVA